MSVRTLIEFNHDHAARIDAEEAEFLRALKHYLYSGSMEAAEALEHYGLKFRGQRHHSDPVKIEFGAHRHEETGS